MAISQKKYTRIIVFFYQGLVQLLLTGLGRHEHRDLRSGHPLQPHLQQPLQAGTYRLSYVLDRIEPFERNPSAVPREKKIVKITELRIAPFSAAYKKKPKFVIIFWRNLRVMKVFLLDNCRSWSWSLSQSQKRFFYRLRLKQKTMAFGGSGNYPKETLS